MKIIIFFSMAAVVSCRGFFVPNRCDRIAPQKNVDWTKLTGGWIHLMYIPGVSDTFLSCKRVHITNADIANKVVDFDFSYAPYRRYGKRIRDDLIFFQWFTDPGIIHMRIKEDVSAAKSSSKFLLMKKTSLAKHARKNASSYNVVATNHKDYIVMVQCRPGGLPIVWISLRSTQTDRNIANEIRNKLMAVDIDVSGLIFDKEGMCIA